MLNILIASAGDNAINNLRNFLAMEEGVNIITCQSGVKARRYAADHPLDIIFINDSLPDENEMQLPFDLAEKSDAAILVVLQIEKMELLSEKMEKAGIFVCGKPVSEIVLLQLLRFAVITQKRIAHMRKKNDRLNDRIQDIKLIDRAKCLLIENQHISEQQAHRFLEKKAMDTQCSRILIAKRIIEKYK